MDRQSRRDEKKPGMILVDTSVWVDFLRGEKSVPGKVLHHLIENEEDISITEIILTEILQGIKEDKDFQATKDYLLNFSVFLPQGIETYLKAARIYRECRKRGKTVRKTVDCLIAAICMENDLILLHNDSDFDHIEACTALKCFHA